MSDSATIIWLSADLYTKAYVCQSIRVRDFLVPRVFVDFLYGMVFKYIVQYMYVEIQPFASACYHNAV